MNEKSPQLGEWPDVPVKFQNDNNEILRRTWCYLRGYFAYLRGEDVGGMVSYLGVTMDPATLHYQGALVSWLVDDMIEFGIFERVNSDTEESLYKHNPIIDPLDVET